MREENVVPVVAVHEAQRKTRSEPAEFPVPPQHASLRGKRPVQHDLLSHVAFAAENVEIPKIDIFTNEFLGTHPPRLLGELAELARGGRLGKIAAHGCDFLRIDHQPVGRGEGRLELRRLKISLPALVIAGPLGEMRGQPRGALQTKPHQQAGTGHRMRVPHFDGERENFPGPVEFQPLLVARGATGPARAGARPNVGLGRDAGHAVLGQVEAGEQPVVTRTI